MMDHAAKLHCEKHPDVPYIERSSGSVNGGTIGWGCAVCNMLRLQEAENLLRKIGRASLSFRPLIDDFLSDRHPKFAPLETDSTAKPEAKS